MCLVGTVKCFVKGVLTGFHSMQWNVLHFHHRTIISGGFFDYFLNDII